MDLMRSADSVVSVLGGGGGVVGGGGGGAGGGGEPGGRWGAGEGRGRRVAVACRGGASGAPGCAARIALAVAAFGPPACKPPPHQGARPCSAEGGAASRSVNEVPSNALSTPRLMLAPLPSGRLPGTWSCRGGGGGARRQQAETRRGVRPRATALSCGAAPSRQSLKVLSRFGAKGKPLNLSPPPPPKTAPAPRSPPAPRWPWPGGSASRPRGRRWSSRPGLGGEGVGVEWVRQRRKAGQGRDCRLQGATRARGQSLACLRRCYRAGARPLPAPCCATPTPCSHASISSAGPSLRPCSAPGLSFTISLEVGGGGTGRTGARCGLQRASRGRPRPLQHPLKLRRRHPGGAAPAAAGYTLPPPSLEALALVRLEHAVVEVEARRRGRRRKAAHAQPPAPRAGGGAGRSGGERGVGRRAASEGGGVARVGLACGLGARHVAIGGPRPGAHGLLRAARCPRGRGAGRGAGTAPRRGRGQRDSTARASSGGDGGARRAPCWRPRRPPAGRRRPPRRAWMRARRPGW
jgi:hypothetical protein